MWARAALAAGLVGVIAFFVGNASSNTAIADEHPALGKAAMRSSPTWRQNCDRCVLFIDGTNLDDGCEEDCLERLISHRRVICDAPDDGRINFGSVHCHLIERFASN